MSQQGPKMTPLETSVVLLLSTFKKYAQADGKDCSLSKSEAKKLLETELPELCSGGKNQQQVNDLIKDLDVDGDGEIDFMEFMILVTTIACAFHGVMTGKK